MQGDIASNLNSVTGCRRNSVALTDVSRQKMGEQNCDTEHNDVFTFSPCLSLLKLYFNLETFITIIW